MQVADFFVRTASIKFTAIKPLFSFPEKEFTAPSINSEQAKKNLLVRHSLEGDGGKLSRLRRLAGLAGKELRVAWGEMRSNYLQYTT